jgi:general secretion pathway protein K
VSISGRTLRECGFALLIVLWSLVLLSLILTQLLSAGRTEAQLAANLRNAAVAEAMADGAVQEALFHLVAQGPLAWAPGQTHIVHIGRGVAEVSIEDLSGKVNPNTADVPVLSAMLMLCGSPPVRAAALAQAIVVWRGDATGAGRDVLAGYQAAGAGYLPPAAPLESLDELGLIIGMTPQLLTCLTPHLSLYQDAPASLRSSDPFVASALRAAAQEGDMVAETPATIGAPAVVITAVATATGARFVRRATARLVASEDRRPFRILRWETGSE